MEFEPATLSSEPKHLDLLRTTDSTHSPNVE